MKIPNPNYICLRFFTGQPGQWCQAGQRTPQFLMGGFSVRRIWCWGLHFSCLLLWDLPVHFWKVNPQHTRGCSKHQMGTGCISKFLIFACFTFLEFSTFLRTNSLLQIQRFLPRIKFYIEKQLWINFHLYQSNLLFKRMFSCTFVLFTRFDIKDDEAELLHTSACFFCISKTLQDQKSLTPQSPALVFKV